MIVRLRTDVCRCDDKKKKQYKYTHTYLFDHCHELLMSHNNII